MSWSPALSYFVERLSGFSSNTFTLQPTNQNNNITANDILTFNIPANSIVNLRSFSVHFNASCVGAGTGGRLPPDIASLFERVEVLAGGISLSQGTNFYNVLVAAKKALSGRGPSAVSGHPEMVRARSYVDGTAIALVAPEVYPALNGECQFCVNHFEGFLSSAEPRCLDSSLLPDLQVRIYLASNAVLASTAGVVLGLVAAAGAATGPTGRGATALSYNLTAGGTGGATYVINNLHAQIECLSLSDQTYDSMLAEQMNSVGFLEVPFQTYYGFNNQHGGSTRWAVASQSINKCYAVWRSTAYNTQAGPLTIQGYKQAGGFTSATAAAATALDQGVPQYDSGGVLDTNKEKYTNNYFNFKSPAQWVGGAISDVRYQWTMNGANIPQSQMRDEDIFQMSMNAELGYNRLEEMSLDQYRENFFVQCVRMDMPTHDYRLISGLDSRAVNLQGSYNTTGTIDPLKNQVTLFIQCTASLKIGAGRALELVH